MKNNVVVEKKPNDISKMCEQVMNSPENNINSLKRVITSNDENSQLCFAKVFASICPMYKIRTGKVKHKNIDDDVEDFDLEVLELYNTFLKKFLKQDTAHSFKIAAYLLNELDHFNFVDRLVAKVILGLNREETRIICLNTLKERILNDQNGEVVALILDQALDYTVCGEICHALLKSPYLGKCVEIKHNLVNKYNPSAQIKKKEKRVKTKRKQLRGKDKKAEKERYLKEKETKKIEAEEMGELDNKTYTKVANGLQRLYFTSLKEKQFISTVCKGLRQYQTLIRQEFHEGLLFLLQENMNINTTSINEVVTTILSMFNKSGIDFTKVLKLYNGVFGNDMPRDFYVEAAGVLKSAYIDTRQNKTIVLECIQAVMRFRAFRFLPCFDEFLREMEIKYDLNYREKFVNGDTNTLYEYFILKKTL